MYCRRESTIAKRCWIKSDDFVSVWGHRWKTVKYYHTKWQNDNWRFLHDLSQFVNAAFSDNQSIYHSSYNSKHLSFVWQSKHLSFVILIIVKHVGWCSRTSQRLTKILPYLTMLNVLSNRICYFGAWFWRSLCFAKKMAEGAFAYGYDCTLISELTVAYYL